MEKINVFFVQIAFAVIFTVLGIFGLFLWDNVKFKTPAIDPCIPADATVLRYSKAFPILAIILAGLSVVINWYCASNDFSWVACTISSLCLLLDACLLLTYFRWRVRIGEDYFEVRTVFSRAHVYEKKEIAGIAENNSVTKLYLEDGTVLRFDSMLHGRTEMIAEFDDYYRYVAKKGFAIPDKAEILFHGYVRNPGVFVILFIVLELMIIGALVFIIILTSIENHIEAPALLTVEVSSYTILQEDASLKIKPDEFPHLFFVNHLEEIMPKAEQTQLKEVLERHVPLLVTVSEKNMERIRANTDGFLRIIELKDQTGHVLISCDVCNAANWRTMRTLIFAIIIIWLLMSGMMIGMFYVMNHAPKYPRLFALCVKEEWRNI